MSSAVNDPQAPRAPRPARPARVMAGGLILPLLLAATCALSILVGVGSFGDGNTSALLDARGDRTMVGILVGAAVAMAGAALQGVTRNPLADPGILGINAGAALFVVIGITFFGIGTLLQYAALALLGALVAAVVVMMLATFGARALGRSGGDGPLSIALAGMVFTAGASSVAQAVLVSNSKSLDVYRFWQVGSVAGRDISDVYPVLPLFLIGFAVLLVSGRRLDVLAMGDSVATGLGQKPQRTRLVVGGAAVLLAAVATSVAGPIAFVGLLAAHLLRPLVGTSYRLLLPASAFVGAIIVVLADVLGRVVAQPSEVQAGIMTAVLGCPALLWVVSRMKSL